MYGTRARSIHHRFGYLRRMFGAFTGVEKVEGNLKIHPEFRRRFQAAGKQDCRLSRHGPFTGGVVADIAPESGVRAGAQAQTAGACYLQFVIVCPPGSPSFASLSRLTTLHGRRPGRSAPLTRFSQDLIIVRIILYRCTALSACGWEAGMRISSPS